MKRWGLRIIVCLILLTGGAITTVAVAWAASTGALDGPEVAEIGTAIDGQNGWTIVHTRLAAGERYRSVVAAPSTGDGEPEVEARSVAPAWIDHLGDVDPLRPPFLSFRTYYGWGWPLRALSMYYEWDRTLEEITTSPSRGGVVFDAVEPAFADEPSVRAFPITPIWPGFVIDTLFYAAIWFGVFFGFASAKRFIRSKRGRCPRCGYDLRGQRINLPHPSPLPEGEGGRAGCPECGWGRTTTAD